MELVIGKFEPTMILAGSVVKTEVFEVRSGTGLELSDMPLGCLHNLL